MEYKIDVLNKFAAFQVEEDVDEDPYEALLKLKEQIVAKKVESSKTANNKKSSSVAAKNDKNAKLSSVQSNHIKATSTKPPNQPLNNNTAKQLPTRPPRMGGPNPSEKNLTERMENKESFNDGFRDRNNRGEVGTGRGGFRGRGRGGPGRASATDRSAGKREFERHSGNDKSGFKPIEKKDGGGSHNWGSIKDDIDEQIRQNDDEGVQKENVETDAQKVEGEEVGEKAEEEDASGAEVERQMTLDEWKQLEEQKRVRNNFKIRKPGEGYRGDPKWNEMFVLKKKVSDEDEDEEEEEEYEEDDEVSRKKNVVPIRITFNDQQKRGRGRGGNMRGGGGQRRGGATENGPTRTPPTTTPAPNVDDENDFPSLA